MMFHGMNVLLSKKNESNSSFAEKKEFAIWDQNVTLAFLSLYEAKIGMLDHPKMKSKIWEATSTTLQQNFGIEMSIDQVRWKLNALIKKYKACVDNNSKSERSLVTFKWFDLGKWRSSIKENLLQIILSHLNLWIQQSFQLHLCQKFTPTLRSQHQFLFLIFYSRVFALKIHKIFPNLLIPR